MYSWRQVGVMTMLVCLAAMAQAADLEKPNGPQKAAASEFLDAVASGDGQAIAYAIHPADLDALRLRLLTDMREEAKRGDSTIRRRLFGQGRPLADIERLTSISFYATLSRRLYLTGRYYKDARWLAAIPDRDGTVQVVLRGEQPKERGKVEVVNVVTIKPYGKDWKATLPSEIEAQIDDLINARRSATAGAPRSAAALAADDIPEFSPPGSRPAEKVPLAPPPIVELLAAAEKSLADGKCDEYYQKQVSPNFRRIMAKKAFESLISGCQNSLATREMLLSTVRIVKDVAPSFEYEGRRAVYDLSGQGLPFERFVLEQVDKKWYVAE